MGILEKCNTLKNHLQQWKVERQFNKTEKNMTVSIFNGEFHNEYRVGDLFFIKRIVPDTNKMDFLLCEEDAEVKLQLLMNIVSDTQFEENLIVTKMFRDIFSGEMIRDDNFVLEKTHFRECFSTEDLTEFNYQLSIADIELFLDSLNNQQCALGISKTIGASKNTNRN